MVAVSKSMSRERPDPSDWTVREARDRYLRRRRADSTDSSVDAWYYRLKLFVEWCEGVGINRVGDLRRFDLDEFYEIRSAKVAPATLEGQMWTLKSFIEFLEDLGAVESDLSDAVRIPDLDPEDRSNDTKLSTPAALSLLEYYREGPEYASRAHVFLELAWIIGARQGGLRALDLQDVHVEEEYVEFRHRPETGTPLKNKRDGERPAGIPTLTAEAIETYIGSNRYDVLDDHGRAPLLASRRGRPGENTIRVWSYLATEPCLHSPCPHGRERDTCELTEYAHASKCPSSRSPHKIRTGSITWQLNQGVPPEVVAERVNASIKTIEQHYDKADYQERRRRRRERMETVRRPHLEKLDLEEAFDDDQE